MSRGRRPLIALAAAAVALIGLALWYLDGSYADSRAEEALDRIFASLPAGYAVTYDSAAASIASDEVVVSGLVVRVDMAELIASYGEELEDMAAAEGGSAEDLAALGDLNLSLTADQWVISDYDTENNPPRFMTQAVSGFAFDIGALLPDENMADLKTLLGGTSVRGDLRLRYVADEATGNVDIPYYDLVIDNVGQFDFAAKFGGYHVWPKPDDPLAAAANLETLTLHHMTFSFADASFFDRAVALAAKRSGLSADELKEQSAMMIAVTVADMKDPRLQAAAVALATFVRDPGRLTLRLAPAKPVNLMAWSELAETDPSAALDQINFSLTKD